MSLTGAKSFAYVRWNLIYDQLRSIIGSYRLMDTDPFAFRKGFNSLSFLFFNYVASLKKGWDKRTYSRAGIS